MRAHIDEYAGTYRATLESVTMQHLPLDEVLPEAIRLVGKRPPKLHVRGAAFDAGLEGKHPCRVAHRRQRTSALLRVGA